MQKTTKSKDDKKSKKKPQGNKTGKDKKSTKLFNGQDSTSNFTKAELDFLDAMGF